MHDKTINNSAFDCDLIHESTFQYIQIFKPTKKGTIVFSTVIRHNGFIRKLHISKSEI